MGGVGDGECFRQGTRLSGLGRFLAGWTPRLEGERHTSGGEMKRFGLETRAEREHPSK